MRILGIDPGLATVGLGLIEANGPQDLTALDWLTIETAAGLPTEQRLHEIATDLTEYLQETKPDRVVTEQLFFSTNVQTAITVAQARGVILATVAAQHLPLIETSPKELKSAITGDGHADKQQMQSMIVRLLELDETPKPDDAADALGLAIYGAIAQ